MPNFRFEISYDGSRYYGWERQPGKDTIQGKLESVLSRMTGKDSEITGAGRTDAGVHARAMIANSHLETELTPDQILNYMNRYLPDDISVNRVSIVSDRFHARYNAAGKLYTYTCYAGDSKPVFNRKYVTILDALPDIDAMREAASFLTGQHDFRSFCSNPKMKKTTVRTVDSIEIVKRKDLIYFNFHGDGFLQNMVRIITGTLLEVGFGRMQPTDIREILEKKDRRMAGPTAPPQGLCLMKVDY
ncbi:MAG: tRNA pseudouridine(38-40) synthase TruA [Oscillospiraceae bacterium]|nr:tRNA pseudouridine(38-40) synthase TruA [Oscillospiraceae bacterium]